MTVLKLNSERCLASLDDDVLIDECEAAFIRRYRQPRDTQCAAKQGAKKQPTVSYCNEAHRVPPLTDNINGLVLSLCRSAY